MVVKLRELELESERVSLLDAASLCPLYSLEALPVPNWLDDVGKRRPRHGKWPAAFWTLVSDPVSEMIFALAGVIVVRAF